MRQVTPLPKNKKSFLTQEKAPVGETGAFS
jgi:hypothetical protein